MYKYYSAKRPITMESLPKGNYKIKSIVNFDGKKFIQSVSKEVYGYVIYYSSLSRTDIYQYELIPNKKY